MTVKLAYSMQEAVDASGLSRPYLVQKILDGQLRARRSETNHPETGEGRGKYVILAADLAAFLDSLTEA